MELLINKRSGKHFIYVSDECDGKVTLVNPNNEVKSVERSLFHESIEGNVKDFLSKALINEMQFKTYREEMLTRENTKEIKRRQAAWEAWEKMTVKQRMDKISAALEKLSPSERKTIVESAVSCQQP